MEKSFKKVKIAAKSAKIQRLKRLQKNGKNEKDAKKELIKWKHTKGKVEKLAKNAKIVRDAKGFHFCQFFQHCRD